jgi:hypothetical protein
MKLGTFKAYEQGDDRARLAVAWSKLFAVVLVVPALLLAGPAAAQGVAILSEGNSTCGEYIAEPVKQSIRMERVLGYISGVNSRAHASEATAGSSFQMPATVIDGFRAIV